MAASSHLNHIHELNLFSLPLTGRTLIEASAGTGKTYSLAFIYLRLLLGLGDNSYPKPLLVEDILVVTFTKAATEELRFRIRQNIHQLRIACVLGYHADPDYQQLIDLIEDKNLALKRLLYAEQNMDEAAIFTIHGFCQRILTTYAFEAGNLFKQTLVKDETSLYLQAVRDFWREYFTPMPEGIARVIWQNWADPESLLADIYPYFNRAILNDNHRATSSLPLSLKIYDFYQQSIAKIQSVKDHWLSVVAEIEPIIIESLVSKRSYNKSHLPRWIESVSNWAKEPTTDYTLAKDLIKFCQTELNNKTETGRIAPHHPLFSEIDQLLATDFSLRNLILFDIVVLVTGQTKQEKFALAQIGFNDLLINLNQALQSDNGQLLANYIMRQYPVAMIDEFQDTDPIQYQIFDDIYQDRANSCLLLIGDPKQAIYGFRGADIFTYIKAKNSVDHYFTMLTNWRSSADMVQAVNSLLSAQNQPFIFNEIPFVSMNYAIKNRHKGLLVNGKPLSALSCYVLPENITTNGDYIEQSAEYCAEQIRNWLSNETYLSDNQTPPIKIQSSDIAILVRTGREAEIIQHKLNKRNIRSVYVSNHKSVFDSLEAREILRILQAILMPTHESYLRSALATRLIGAPMDEIDNLTNEPNQLEQLVEEFKGYQTVWFNHGVLVTLRRLMNQRHLAENLLSLIDGERIITNFMHLGELLQQVSAELDTPHALLRWLTKQINQPDRNMENHEQRLESDENLINIVTIHKSKGLEYPIVCLPFIGLYRESDSSVYHDPTTYDAKYAFNPDYAIKQRIEQERLAEDLRLLYVALTRSIYHCSIGLAGLKKGRSDQLSLANSAIGYLLLNGGEQNSYQYLWHQLHQLAQTSVTPVELPITVSLIAPEFNELQHLSANIFKRKLDYVWRVTSYSGLQHTSALPQEDRTSLVNELFPTFDQEVIADSMMTDENRLLGKTHSEINDYDIHHFAKGAIVGTLLHECFENTDFTKPDIPFIVNNLLTKLNLDDNWLKPLSQWFKMVLHSPLAPELCLAKLPLNQRLNELQFYIPIRKAMTAVQLDKLCKQYDPLSKQCEALNFATIQGMLKGFIDMVFEWQGKYYIVDYKSNYLGESAADYTRQTIAQAMCEHRYDLQYQLYSLALHRYLKSRLPNYQYQSHFGGIYYLFIRGMTDSDSGNGIFYTKPEKKFIEELDLLFG